MVNSKKKEILERYRYLLENNLVLTDQFLQWLKIRKALPDFILDDLQALPPSAERNHKFLNSILDNGDQAFTKLYEGLIGTGQPFLGELLENEDRKAAEASADSAERPLLDDDFLKKCPGVDKLRADTRDKLKNYLQDQLLKVQLRETGKSQNQGKAVEVLNLKRQHYDAQQVLAENLDQEKRQVVTLKDSLRGEQQARQQREEEMKELRSELNHLQSDFEHKWSSQMKMNDANNRSVFKMNDKIAMLADWLRSLDLMFKTNILQTGLDADTMDQLQNKLKKYTEEIQATKTRGIGTDQLKEELYESLYTSRYLPIEDRKNQSFHDLLVRLYGANQVTELATICTKDVVQSKLERDQSSEIRIRDVKIEELNQLNRALQAEIDRLKAVTTESVAAAPAVPKAAKPQWRPVPSSVAVAPREKTKSRQTLKPISVQFGTKPPGN